MKNLTKANKLIEQLAEKDNRITPITPKDENLFAKYFKSEPHTYGNSWTYVTQGMYGIGPHGLGYKYYDGKNLSTVCVYPKIEQPDLHCFYWVRPMGSKILDIIDTYSKELLSTQSMPTYVKKIFKDQFQSLVKKGFKDTSKFPWHTSCPSEDDTYPEVIIDVKGTLKNKNKSRMIKNIFKRCRSLSLKVKIVKIENEEQRTSAWEVVNYFFEQDIKTLGHNISTPDDYLNPLYSSINKDHDIFLIMEHSFTRGVFDLNKIDNQYYSSYAALMLRETLHNLNEYSVIYSCNLILKKNGSYLNLGGSESRGLDLFKNKFEVKRLNQMQWATYY